MAAALAFAAAPSAGQKALTTVTVNVTGAAATTAYYATISNPDVHIQTVQFKTDGSGAASFTFVPVLAGTYTLNIYPSSPASAANATLNIGGHG